MNHLDLRKFSFSFSISGQPLSSSKYQEAQMTQQTSLCNSFSDLIVPSEKLCPKESLVFQSPDSLGQGAIFKFQRCDGSYGLFFEVRKDAHWYSERQNWS